MLLRTLAPRRVASGLLGLGVLVWLGAGAARESKSTAGQPGAAGVSDGSRAPVAPPTTLALVESAEEITVGEYASEPDEHYGKSITLSGPIEQLSENTLALDGRVLVVGAKPLRDTSGRLIQRSSTAWMRITGTARSFDGALSRDLGLDVGAASLVHWLHAPAVVPSFIEPIGAVGAPR